MIPILFDYSDTSWTSNGRGRLSDCISCTVTEERNGVYECEFKYPITGAHYDEILEGRVIGVIHDDTKTMEPFDIYARSAEIDGVVTFYAHHISYRLLNIIVNPFTAYSVAEVMGDLSLESININPFNFMTDKTTMGTFTLTTPKSIREMLCGSQGSILDVYGTGEYEFTRYDVKLWLHRGQDTDVEIRYGKNLIDIDKETDASGTYNAIAPYWYSPEEGLITLPEKIVISDTLINTGTEPWTNENGTIITDENLTPIEFDYATITIIPMDMTTDFEDVPTVEQLREKAKSKLASSSAWLPNENIKVDFVTLWQTEEYKDVAPLQRVSLCDTVGVYFPQLGVSTRAKVIRTVYNVLLECYDEMELGDPRYSFAETISTSTIERVTNTMASKSFLAASLDQATKLLTGGLGGYVVMNPNADGQPQEILVMDTDDINTAVNVIRINKNGIGFSRTGYNGPFATAWTIDGHFVADFIDSGTLSANLIRGGSIQSLSGESSWNLNSGIFRTKSGRSITQISGGQMSFLLVDNGEEKPTAAISPIAWGGDYENGRGVMLTAREGATYLALAHQTGNDYAADLIINNGLNPSGRTEKVQVRGSLYISGNLTIHTNAIFDQLAFFYTGIALETTSHEESTASNRASMVVETSGGYAGALKISPGNNTFTMVGKGLSDFAANDFTKANATAAVLYVTGNIVTDNKILPSTDYITEQKSVGSETFRFYQVWTSSLNFASGVYINYNSSTDRIYSSKSITQGSDERLKNIKPYNDKYDALLDVLEPIIYTWKDRPDGAEYVGLGARKTAALIDDLGIEKSGFVGIGENDKGEEVYGIDYNELSVMLLHKVKKQQEEIDTLKAQLDAVLTRLERLEGKNADT